MVAKLNRKSLRAPEKSGHYNVPGTNQEVVHNARLRVICQHSPWGTCRPVQALRQRSSHHPIVLVTYGAAINSKGTTIKLHSARCYESTSLTMQKAAGGMLTQFHSSPPEFCLPHQNPLHNCEFPQVSFRCASGQTLSLLLHVCQTSLPTNLIPYISCCLEDCPTNSKPMIFISCTIFGLRSGFVMKSEGFTFVPHLLRDEPL